MTRVGGKWFQSLQRIQEHRNGMHMPNNKKKKLWKTINLFSAGLENNYCHRLHIPQ